jgi:hypothetical protein
MGGVSKHIHSERDKRMGSKKVSGESKELTRRKVLHFTVELTGLKQAGHLFAGKIERSAEAFQM